MGFTVKGLGPKGPCTPVLYTLSLKHSFPGTLLENLVSAVRNTLVGLLIRLIGQWRSKISGLYGIALVQQV